MKKYFQVPWDIKDVLIVLVSISAFLLISYFTIQLLDLRSYFSNEKTNSLTILLIFLIQWVVILIPLIILTWKKYKLKIKHFGFNKVGKWNTTKLIIGAFLTYIFISLIINILIIYTGVKIPGYQIQEKVIPLFGDDTVSIVLAGIIIVGIAPFLEEIFFRGFLLRTIVNKYGILCGTVITALIFAIFHMQWASIIPIFIIGLIINSIVINSKSLYPSILFHMFNNGLAFTVELLILKDIIKI
jgi:uncharacterized protein